ncbi:MAG: murein biosynthesis integral membrane protein MurJ [Rubricoccaceae bacterium]|nr:murein biosynthesis integral membrane protein MurJ [Rubricoccaceae bacterium]
MTDAIQQSNMESEPDQGRRGSGAPMIALGILLSRILGLVREKVVAYFFGLGAHYDVFQLAMKGANLLNNLLGEGTLSASFIPIYSRMLEEGREREARRFAGAVLGLLLVTLAVVTAIGVLAAKYIVTLIAPGFLDDAALVATGELPIDRFDLAVQAFRITVPMAAFLALSAWALGVLNSHRRFFLPYFAPTLMNVAVIAVLVFAGTSLIANPFSTGGLEVVPVAILNRLVIAAVLGALLGGILQFGIQLPLVLRLLRGFRLSVSRAVEGVTDAFRAFWPVVAGRGVAQLSSYVDVILAGLATAGTIGALRPALVLYMLPISLFGMSVAASELPELSRISSERLITFTDRINRSIRQMLYLVVPTAVGYVLFGFLIVSALFGGGAFEEVDAWLVYLILGGYTLGLGATAVSRLLQNSFYALHDTKTPAKIAVLRVVISGIVGAGLMFWLDSFLVSDVIEFQGDVHPLTLAAVGLAIGTSVGAWIELLALRMALSRALEEFQLPTRRVIQMGGLAVASALPAFGAMLVLRGLNLPVLVDATVVLALYGVLYLTLGHFLRFTEGDAWIQRLRRRGPEA